MFLVVSSRDDLIDTVLVVAGSTVQARNVADADRLWTKADPANTHCIGVLIDFRDQVVARSALVDRIVRSRAVVGIIACIDPNRSDLLFELARRGVHGWTPAPPDYQTLKKLLLRVVAETTITSEYAMTIALEREKQQQNGLSRQEIERTLAPLAGPSRATQHLRETILRVAYSDVPVVLTGETGAGKQVVAELIHKLSGRRENPCLDVNICGITDTLFESELFGALPGAYTDAVRRKGYFAIADGGTLFLDEIGDLSPGLQPKLLKAVENGVIYRVGSEKPEHVDVRLICATNRNLEVMVETGGFREDLWHRISTIVITVPPLRDRLEDIPILVKALLTKIGYDHVILQPEAILALQEHKWKGNIRELRSVLERSVVHTRRTELRARDILFSPHVANYFMPEPDVF